MNQNPAGVDLDKLALEIYQEDNQGGATPQQGAGDIALLAEEIAREDKRSLPQLSPQELELATKRGVPIIRPDILRPEIRNVLPKAKDLNLPTPEEEFEMINRQTRPPVFDSKKEGPKEMAQAALQEAKTLGGHFVFRTQEQSYRLLNKAADWIAKKGSQAFGWNYEDIKPKLFQKLSTNAKYFADKFEAEGIQIPIIKEVLQGIGQAGWDIPQFMILGPYGLAVHGAATGLVEDGIKGAVFGGTTGALTHGSLKGMSYLPKGAKLPTMFGFGAATTPGGIKERTAGGLTWVSLGLGGKEKGVPIKDLFQDWKKYRPLMEERKARKIIHDIAPEVSDIAIKKEGGAKAMLDKAMRDVERDEVERLAAEIKDAERDSPENIAEQKSIRAETDKAFIESAAAKSAELNKARPKRSVSDFLKEQFDNLRMESMGEAALNNIIDRGASPQGISEEFWNNTYDKLPDVGKRRIEKYLQKLSGMKIGDAIAIDKEGRPIVAESWKQLGLEQDLGKDASMLEGADRGYVVLLDYANNMIKKSRLSPEGDLGLPPVPPTEIEAQRVIKEKAGENLVRPKPEDVAKSSVSVESPELQALRAERERFLEIIKANPKDAADGYAILLKMDEKISELSGEKQPAQPVAPEPTPKPTVPESTPVAKEPWQMTREEWIEDVREREGYYNLSPQQQKTWDNSGGAGIGKAISEHDRLIDEAIKEGKPVPLENKPDWALTAKDAARRSDDIFDGSFQALHKKSVEKAISEGNPVPPEVLAEYPDLAKPTPPVSTETKTPATSNALVAGAREHLAGLAGIDDIPADKIAQADTITQRWMDNEISREAAINEIKALQGEPTTPPTPTEVPLKPPEKPVGEELLKELAEPRGDDKLSILERELPGPWKERWGIATDDVTENFDPDAIGGETLADKLANFIRARKRFYRSGRLPQKEGIEKEGEELIEGKKPTKRGPAPAYGEEGARSVMGFPSEATNKPRVGPQERRFEQKKAGEPERKLGDLVAKRDERGMDIIKKAEEQGIVSKKEAEAVNGILSGKPLRGLGEEAGVSHEAIRKRYNKALNKLSKLVKGDEVIEKIEKEIRESREAIEKEGIKSDEKAEEWAEKKDTEDDGSSNFNLGIVANPEMQRFMEDLTAHTAEISRKLLKEKLGDLFRMPYWNKKYRPVVDFLLNRMELEPMRLENMVSRRMYPFFELERKDQKSFDRVREILDYGDEEGVTLSDREMKRGKFNIPKWDAEVKRMAQLHEVSYEEAASMLDKENFMTPKLTDAEIKVARNVRQGLEGVVKYLRQVAMKRALNQDNVERVLAAMKKEKPNSTWDDAVAKVKKDVNTFLSEHHQIGYLPHRRFERWALIEMSGGQDKPKTLLYETYKWQNQAEQAAKVARDEVYNKIVYDEALRIAKEKGLKKYYGAQGKTKETHDLKKARGFIDQAFYDGAREAANDRVHVRDTSRFEKNASGFMELLSNWHLIEKIAGKIDVEQQGSEGAKFKEALGDKLYQYFAKGALAHRKKTAGWSKDITKTLKSYISTTPYSYAKRFYRDELEKVKNTLPEEDRNYANNMIDFFMGRKQYEGKGINAASRFVYNWYLGGKIAFAPVNMSQILVTTWPKLSAELKDIIRNPVKAHLASDKILAKSVLDTFKLYDLWNKSSREEKYGKARKERSSTFFYDTIQDAKFLNKEQKRLLKRLSDEGLLGAVRQKEMVGKEGERVNFQSLLGMPASFSEKQNRLITALAAYDVAKRKGIGAPEHFEGFEEIYQYVKGVVNDTQFVYSKATRPVVSRGGMKPVTALKSYLFNYGNFLKSMAPEGEVWKTGALAKSIMTSVALGGVMGIPFYNTFESLIVKAAVAAGYLADEEEGQQMLKSVKDFVDEKTLGIALRGLPALARIQGSWAFGSPELFSLAPLSAYQRAKTAFEGWGDSSVDLVEKFARSSPKALSSILRTYQLAIQKKLPSDIYGRPKIPASFLSRVPDRLKKQAQEVWENLPKAEDVDAWDYLLEITGMPSAKKAKLQEGTYFIKGTSKKILSSQTEGNRQIADIIWDGLGGDKKWVNTFKRMTPSQFRDNWKSGLNIYGKLSNESKKEIDKILREYRGRSLRISHDSVIGQLKSHIEQE